MYGTVGIGDCGEEYTHRVLGLWPSGKTNQGGGVPPPGPWFDLYPECFWRHSRLEERDGLVIYGSQSCGQGIVLGIHAELCATAGELVSRHTLVDINELAVRVLHRHDGQWQATLGRHLVQFIDLLLRRVNRADEERDPSIGAAKATKPPAPKSIGLAEDANGGTHHLQGAFLTGVVWWLHRFTLAQRKGWWRRRVFGGICSGMRSSFEADQAGPLVGRSVPGNEQEVAVSDRCSVLLPLIPDPSYRRPLGGFISIAQNAMVFLSELAP
jgi:hypothetical protein